MSSFTTCVVCGQQQPAGSPYCAKCGSPLPGLGTGNLPPHFTLQGGRYVILGTVGRGGMGAVYKAADTRLGGKVVAIKELSDAAITSGQQKLLAIAAFRQEAQMLAHLNHPNLPRVTDYFTELGKHYIVMEFVEGETLEDYLTRRGGSVTEDEARGWAVQLCDVLGYLHRQSPPVIFRDLKPANVMLTPDGQLKLIDFGIARLFKAGKPGDTLVMGTPGYAAPEQYGQGQTDGRSDVYSLGVLLHHTLTGHEPSLTPFVLPPVRRLTPSISAHMEQIVAKATQTDQALRFQNVEEMCQELRSAGTRMPVRNRGRQVWLMAAVGIALLVGLCSGAYFVVGRSGILERAPAPVPALVADSTTSRSSTPSVAPTEDPPQLPAPASTQTLPATSEPLPTSPTIVVPVIPTVTMLTMPVLPTVDAPALPVLPATNLPVISTVVVPTMPVLPTLVLPVVPGTDSPPPVAPTSTELPTMTPLPTSFPTPTPLLPGLGQGRIVFVSERDGNPEIYTMAGDGSNQTRVTRNGANDWSPAWSPDSARIAFTSSRDATVAGMHNIYVMNSDGAGVFRLTYNQAWDDFPAFSPNGHTIAFVTTADGNAEIFAVEIDGSDYRRLTYEAADDRAPSWSPDGQRIAFSSRRSGLWQIYTMNADGSNPTRLTFSNANDQEPAWSSDGRRIAFFSDRDGNAEIYIMDVNGSNQTRLTFDASRDEHPSWSPDGAAVAFWSNRAGRNNDVYVMWADGSQPTRLTVNRTPDGAPDWAR